MSVVLGFTINDIKYYLLTNDGIVEYHELVKAFRHHLSDQRTQNEARIAFKDYVNRLATVVTQQGQKYLVLRPEFRHQLEKNIGNITDQRLDQMNDNVVVNAVRMRVDNRVVDSQPVNDNIMRARVDNQRSMDQLNDNVVKVRVNQRVERMDSLNSIGLPVAMEPPIGLPLVDNRVNRYATRTDMRVNPIVSQTKQMIDSSVTNFSRTPSRHLSFSEDTDYPPQPPPRRRNSAANKASLDRFKQFEDERAGHKYSNENQPEGPSHQIDKLKEIHELSIQTPGRVKERAQKIDKMASLTELKPPMPSTPGAATLTNGRPKSRTGTIRDSEDTGSVQSWDPLRRRWILSASNCDYNSLVLCLKEDANLSLYKDFTNGYTALHWAAKFAKLDVIKLLAGTYGANPNAKSHGGYTPLHLAAIAQNESVMRLLTNVYHADRDIRDNNGKRPDQYLNHNNTHKNSSGKHSNGVIASQPTNNNGPNGIPKSITARLASESTSSTNFIRIGSLKAANKVKRYTGLGPKSWGSIESIPETNNVSKKTKKNKKNSKRDATPESQRERDSDSDSAYGFQ